MSFFGNSSTLFYRKKNVLAFFENTVWRKSLEFFFIEVKPVGINFGFGSQVLFLEFVTCVFRITVSGAKFRFIGGGHNAAAITFLSILSSTTSFKKRKHILAYVHLFCNFLQTSIKAMSSVADEWDGDRKLALWRLCNMFASEPELLARLKMAMKDGNERCGKSFEKCTDFLTSENMFNSDNTILQIRLGALQY